MILAPARPLSRTSLLIIGLAAALALRLLIAGNQGSASALAALVFAAALALLVLVAGWRPGRLQFSALVIGLLGGAILVATPVWLRASSPIATVGLPLSAFPVWAAIVTMVAVAEELLLRGVLFDAIDKELGGLIAVAATTVLFGLLHVPLYGWHILPVDLAVGMWLGGLRLVTGSVVAPAFAHVVADLSTWWLL